MSAADSRPSREQDERLTPEAFWRWAWTSIRPYLGYVLVLIGLILLVVAYFGVSREIYVARQIPYLISGGLFGLAAVTLGSRMILIEDLRRDSGRLERLEIAVTELRAALLVHTDYPTATDLGTTGTIPSIGAASQVVALRGGATFHRSDCSMLRGKKTISALDVAAAVDKGLTPCKLCQPLAA